MRYLGVDFGERRIGVAVSDEEASLALPLGIVERRDDYQAIGELRDIARDRGVGALVVGRPTHVDGRLGATADRVRRFGERLALACHLPLFFVDEALTSIEARRLLQQAETPQRRQREAIDALAARIQLQEWLDQEDRP